jgi:hypothetical protein
MKKLLIATLLIGIPVLAFSMSDREHYKHLYEVTHGFSKRVPNPDGSPGLTTLQSEFYVCFFEKTPYFEEGHTGIFLTFNAAGFSKRYAEVSNKTPLDTAALDTIQKTFDPDAPYVTVMQTLELENGPLPDGLEILELSTYTEGVKTGSIEYHKRPAESAWLAANKPGARLSIGPDLKFVYLLPKKDGGSILTSGSCEAIPAYPSH